MSLFKHNASGKYYRLVISRESGVNTYLNVDKDNAPIIERRSWSCRNQEQHSIIISFKNLSKV